MWGRRFLTAMFSWLTLATAAPAGTVMTAEEFTRFYAEKAETLLPGVKATVKGELEVHLEVTPESDGIVVKNYLDNAFREYSANPSEIDTIVSRYVNSFRGSFEKEQKFAREQLVLVIRHKSIVDAELTDLLHWPLAGDIHAIYAFDTPDAVQYPPSEMVKALGLDEMALKALALDNLKRIRTAPQIETHPTLAFVSSADSYLPSILLEDDFWSAERFPFRGDIVVIAAARDLLLVTGSLENEGLETIAKIAHQVASEAPHAISTEPIVRRDGAWQSFIQ
jgi:uncharacterized protein YtpQ (UPF0354 family)